MLCCREGKGNELRKSVRERSTGVIFDAAHVNDGRKHKDTQRQRIHIRRRNIGFQAAMSGKILQRRRQGRASLVGNASDQEAFTFSLKNPQRPDGCDGHGLEHSSHSRIRANEQPRMLRRINSLSNQHDDVAAIVHVASWRGHVLICLSDVDVENETAGYLGYDVKGTKYVLSGIANVFCGNSVSEPCHSDSHSMEQIRRVVNAGAEANQFFIESCVKLSDKFTGAHLTAAVTPPIRLKEALRCGHQPFERAHPQPHGRCWGRGGDN